MAQAGETNVDDANELVIGLVGPVGCGLSKVEEALSGALIRFCYSVLRYKLSDLFKDAALPTVIDESTEYDRLRTAMDAGDALRKETHRPEIMAIHGIAEIWFSRGRGEQPLRRVAHVLHSLKRPEEVHTLRDAYGQRFVLISMYVPRDERISLLMQKDMPEHQAVELVVRDEKGGDDYGQSTSETFQFADLFLDGRRSPEEVESEIVRFLDLLFGSRLVTPRQEEHAMFVAFACSLRSGDLSRQVGAVIADEQGSVLAMGSNDAPRFGGGPYWPTSDDARDLVLGHDSNDRIRRQELRKMLEMCGKWEPGEDELKLGRKVFGEGHLLDITEYGRAVHAEMAALTDCARRGVATERALLYCTTFPCHNCVKHLVAAGIQRVCFIEPYPKSRAFELHGDSVTADELVRSRMQMLPFVGIGPRRYAELFSLHDRTGDRIRRKGVGGKLAPWDRCSASPLLPGSLLTFLDSEERAAGMMAVILKELRVDRGPASKDSDSTLA